MPGVIVKEGAPQLPEERLRAFIAKFERKDQARIRAARKWMRRRLPTAVEMVYDNYNFLVIGYSPTERPSDAVLSLAAGANGLGLCFLHGARIPDPGLRARFFTEVPEHVALRELAGALTPPAARTSRPPAP